MRFGKGYWKTFSKGIEREWVITNGIGGYCGSSIIGANTRKHHGMLIASLHAPVQRYMVLSKIDETVSFGTKEYSLAATQRPAGYQEGQKHLQTFEYDELPNYHYQTEEMFITKTLAFERERNTITVGYDIINGSKQAEIKFTPLFNFREHGEKSEKADLDFNVAAEEGDTVEVAGEFAEREGGLTVELVVRRTEDVDRQCGSGEDDVLAEDLTAVVFARTGEAGFVAVARIAPLRDRSGDDVEHVAVLRHRLFGPVRGDEGDGEGGVVERGHPEERRIVPHHQQRADFDSGKGGVGGRDHAGFGDGGGGDAPAGDLVFEPLMFLLRGVLLRLEVGDEARFILDDGRKNVREVAFLVLEAVAVQHVRYSLFLVQC